MDINSTLADRGNTHGDFSDNAAISQNLKAVMHTGKNWHSLPKVQKEALDMIVHKIARILSGDNNNKDSWHDLQGYARLAEERIEDAPYYETSDMSGV